MISNAVYSNDFCQQSPSISIHVHTFFCFSISAQWSRLWFLKTSKFVNFISWSLHSNSRTSLIFGHFLTFNNSWWLSRSWNSQVVTTSYVFSLSLLKSLWCSRRGFDLGIVSLHLNVYLQQTHADKGFVTHKTATLPLLLRLFDQADNSWFGVFSFFMFALVLGNVRTHAYV